MKYSKGGKMKPIGPAAPSKKKAAKKTKKK
jgi:hypothetical protein